MFLMLVYFERKKLLMTFSLFRSFSFLSKGPAVVVLAAMLMAGCNSAPEGPAVFPVTGTVTFDGTPITEGRIQFRKTDGDQQAFSGEIKDGNYSLEAQAGSMKVEVLASRPTGKFDTSNPDEPPQPIGEMYIPAKYNAETSLTAEVKSSGGNVIPFELTGK